MLLLWAQAAWAATVHEDQAKIFLRRRYFDEALVEVQAGLADPTADAFGLYTVGTDAAWELGNIDLVLLWSQQAADLTMNPDLHDAWQARHDVVAATWGWVQVVGPRPDGVSPLQIEAAGAVLDPDQKRISNAVALALRDRTPLPARVSLPIGAWKVNGVPVTVRAGEVSEVSLSAEQLGLAGLATLQTVRVEVALGAQLWTGAEQVERLPPTGTIQVTVSGPLGPLLLGGTARWAPQSYVSDRGQAFERPFAGGIGLVIGGDLPLAGAIAIRPGLGVEGALLQGLRIGEESTTLYVPGVGVGPSASVGVEWRRAGRSTATAFGVSLAGSMATGATVGETTPVSFTAGAVRIGAYVGL